MGAESFRHYLRELLSERGWSLPKLAKVSGYSRGYLWELAAGRNAKRPSPEVLADLDLALGADGTLILAWAEGEVKLDGQEMQNDLSAFLLEGSPAGDEDLRRDLSQRGDDAGLDLRLVDPVWRGGPAWEEIVAQQSMDFATRARRSAMDSTVLENLEAQLRRISRDYLHAPHPRAHFTELVAVRDHAFRQIESQRPRPDQSRQLHALAGIACALLAQSTHELGFRRAAMTHAHAAIVCAELAGFDSLQVWIRATQAAIAEYAGLPMETVRYAQAGRAHASQGTAVVRLMSLAANGHARMGNLAEARSALEAAERARDVAADDDPLDDFGGVLAVSLAKQHAYAASAWALLGQGPAATAAATRALDLYRAAEPDRRQPVNEGYAHIDVALGHMLSGELDGVSDALAPVLALPVHARVDLLHEKLRRVHQRLSDVTLAGGQPRAVLAIQGQIEEFVASADTPALP